MPRAKYTSRKCLNSNCPKGLFIPSRSDQKFCDSICRSSFHFHLRKAEEKTKYRTLTDLKNADKELGLLYKSCRHQNLEFISEEVIRVNSIPLNSAIQIAIDKKSNCKIFWFYDFGIMGIEKNKFKIVKKSDYGKL